MIRPKQIRAALREAPDGLTVTELEVLVPVHRTHIGRILKSMADAYIDRWVGDTHWSAVWCVVIPPENCPKPRKKK